MDFSIHGLGGAYTKHRKSAPRKRVQGIRTVEGSIQSATPAFLAEQDGWLSEHQRAEFAGIDQAVQATETALAVVQAAQREVEKVSHWVSVVAEVIAQAVDLTANEGTSATRRDWLQEELDKAREASDKVVASARFGKLRLLDGSLGLTGQAFGEGLAYVGALSKSRSSPPEGYPVHIWRVATQAVAVGDEPLRQAYLNQALRLAIEADGRQAVLYPRGVHSAAKVVEALREKVRENNLEIQVGQTADGRLLVRHARYGSTHCFSIRSSVPGVLSMPDGSPRFVNNGQDVAGSINEEPAFGEGQVLTGCAGNRTTDGLSVRFSGTLPEGKVWQAPREGPRSNWNIGLDDGPAGMEVGRVILSHQPLVFRLGLGESEAVSLSLNAMRTAQLGLGVENASGFQSLADIQLGSGQEILDAQEIATRAQEEICDVADRLAELSSQVLGQALAGLRTRAEQVGPSLTNISDKGMALSLTQTLKKQLHAQAGAALAAQPNPVRGAMMRLLA